MNCRPRHQSNAMTVASPFSGLDQVFEGSFPATIGRWKAPVVAIRPSVDVVEEADKILIKADMPGLEKSEIKVMVQDGVLKIEGKREEQTEETREGYSRSERFMGTISRSFNLPAWADGGKIGADYKNGVLTVTIPKSESARPRTVDIQVS